MIVNKDFYSRGRRWIEGEIYPECGNDEYKALLIMKCLRKEDDKK